MQYIYTISAHFQHVLCTAQFVRVNYATEMYATNFPRWQRRRGPVFYGARETLPQAFMKSELVSLDRPTHSPPLSGLAHKTNIECR